MKDVKMSVRLSMLSDFLSVALSSESIGFYWKALINGFGFLFAKQQVIIFS